jgi:hypothetical protein
MAQEAGKEETCATLRGEDDDGVQPMPMPLPAGDEQYTADSVREFFGNMPGDSTSILMLPSDWRHYCDGEAHLKEPGHWQVLGQPGGAR